MNHIKLISVSMEKNPEINERWLQDIIVKDPSILGIGDVMVKDKERMQPNAGRLDLLLQDAEGNGRYEVEIQLGATDASHIIRTLEYWDIERKKYPQYDHTAIIIAEDITSRFFNVIGLFNGFIPIMAIQVTAIKMENGIGLQFTKILDTQNLGMIDEDEDSSELTDRNYWETKKGTNATVALADKILDIVKSFEKNAELSYNKQYIGFWINGRAKNFAICKPQKGGMRMSIKLPKSEDVTALIDTFGIDIFEYDHKRKKYRLKVTEQDIQSKSEGIGQLLKLAYERNVN